MRPSSVWFLVVFTKPDGQIFGICLDDLWVDIYFRYRKGRKITATGRLRIEQIAVPGYKPIKVKKILVPTKGGMNTETVQAASEIATFHNATLTALHVLEIPESLPLDTPIPETVEAATAVLKRAEAIARDLNVPIEFKMIRSRSLRETILEVAKQGKYDLIVLGTAGHAEEGTAHGVGSLADTILREAPCRVWLLSQ